MLYKINLALIEMGRVEFANIFRRFFRGFYILNTIKACPFIPPRSLAAPKSSPSDFSYGTVHKGVVRIRPKIVAVGVGLPTG